MLRMFGCRRSFRRSLLAVVGLAGMSLLAVGCHGGPHGARDPEKMKRFVKFAVSERLDDIKATAPQREVVLGATQRLLDGGLALRKQLRASRPQLLAQWESATPDGALLHGLVDEQGARIQKFAHSVVDELLAVHRVLTPGQRGQLIEPLRERMAEEGE